MTRFPGGVVMVFLAMVGCGGATAGRATTPTKVPPPITDLTFCVETPVWNAEYEPDPYEGMVAPCNDKGIATIEQVAALKDLKRLRIIGEWSGGLAALAQLGQLEELRVEYAIVDDLAPLAKLPRLRVLEVRSGRADLTPLGKLTALEQLTLDSDADLTPLGKLTTLDELALDGDADLMKKLPTLPPLKRLVLSTAGSFSIKSLRDQPRLESLSVRAETIADVAALASLPPLRTVSLTSAHAIPELARLAQIEKLDVEVPLEALSFAELSALRKSVSRISVTLAWSPCEIEEYWTIEPGDELTRAEYDEHRRDNHSCRNQGE